MSANKKRYSIKELEVLYRVEIQKSSFTDNETGITTYTYYTLEEKEKTFAPYWLKAELEDKLKKEKLK